MMEPQAVLPALEATDGPAPGLDVRSIGAHRTARPGHVGTLVAAVASAGLTLAAVGSVVMIQQERGTYGSFDPGATGPALVAAGLVGAIAGGIVLYLSHGPR